MGEGQVDKLNGYQMRYEHYRLRCDGGGLDRYHRGRSDWQPAERGGCTFCTIADEDGITLVIGAAKCSRKDAFCYRIGRQIAKGRALKALAGVQAEQV